MQLANKAGGNPLSTGPALGPSVGIAVGQATAGRLDLGGKATPVFRHSEARPSDPRGPDECRWATP